MKYNNKKKKMGGKKMWGMPMDDKVWSCDSPMPANSGSLESGPYVIKEQMKRDFKAKTNKGKSNPNRF